MQKELASQDKVVVHYHGGGQTKVIDNKKRKIHSYAYNAFDVSVVLLK